jgi:A/G-specific adenine glycosylase
VRRRPAEGFLGGLWELPVADLCDGEPPLSAAVRLAMELGQTGTPAVVGQLKHAYSHFTVDLALARLSGATGGRVAEGSWQWLPLTQLRDTPLHGAHRKAMQRLLGGADG